MSEKKSHENLKELDFSQYSRKIFTAIPPYIPVEAIKLLKLPDGYNISVNHKESQKNTNGSYMATFIYEIEEHYGIKVEDLRGGFNAQHLYEIYIKFEDQ